MAFNFKNRAILISGIARGIGRALALEAAQRGMKVAGIDVKTLELNTLKEELTILGAPFYLEEVDIRDADACARFVSETIHALGRLDVLINNAGITYIAPENETSVEQTKRLMEINFLGMVHLSHSALPEIIKNKGILAGVSSVAGYSPLLYRTAYAASKHAVWGYLSSLRTELREKEVGVLTICPSFVRTDLQESQQKYFTNNTGEVLTPENVANEIFKGIGNRKEILLIGKTAKRVYWLNRFFPKLYERIMVRKTQA